MKSKLLITALAAVAMALTAFAAPSAAIAAEEYCVDGGRIEIDFDDSADEDLFILHTEFGTMPQIIDGKLAAWPLAEQKMFLEGQWYSDVDVSVEISTINENGKFDAGIYVQGMPRADGTFDGVTAWNVNVEHGAGERTFWLKLHRYVEGNWKLVLEIPGYHFYKPSVRLRTVVKNGILYAFLYGQDEPEFSYEIGNSYGLVGLRSYYSPNLFDNFCVTGQDNPVDLTKLSALLEQARVQDFDIFTKESSVELREAIEFAEAVVAAPVQKQVDVAVCKLQQALSDLIKAYDFDALQNLIERASSLQNPAYSVYSKNSWDSLMAVTEICKKLTAEDTEQQISYWYGRLELRINALIAYGGSGQ